MEKIQVRLPKSIIEWVKQMAIKENVPISTMIRLYLDREMYRENIEKSMKGEK